MSPIDTGNPGEPPRPISPDTSGGDKSTRVNKPAKPVEGRHGRLPSDRSIRLMSACEARRIALGLSYADVNRGTSVDQSDVSRALRLIEEPTARTIRRLCSFFEIDGIDNLARSDAEIAILYSMAYHGKAIGKLAERLIKKKGEDDG